MKKLLGIKFLAIILTLSTLATNSLGATRAVRINFVRGASSSTKSGTIAAGATREFVINVRRNQNMTIEVASGNNRIVIDVDDVNGHLQYGDGFSEIYTNANGDHWITLKNEGGRATRYTMTVSVR